MKLTKVNQLLLVWKCALKNESKILIKTDGAILEYLATYLHIPERFIERGI